MTLSRAAKKGRFDPERLFRPKSFAVLGPEAASVLRNLRAGGFRGDIAEDADAGADLAVLTGDDPCAQTLAAAAASGTRAAVVLGMPPDLAEAAHASGIRALGPGSFGLCVPSTYVHASAFAVRPAAGRLALVSQSAALCRAVIDWAGANGVGFSAVVGVGGSADMGFAVPLDWLSQDAGTGAVLLDIRRIRDGRAFLSAARATARLRPVVAICGGLRTRDPSGATGAAFEAAMRRAGVLLVETLDDLLTAAETLARTRPARDDALAIVSNGHGPAQLAADAVQRDGLHLAYLRPETRAVLSGVTGGMVVSASEPVHVGAATPGRLADVAAMLAGAREVGGIVIVHAPTGGGDDAAGHDAAAIAAIAAGGKALRVPVLVAALGEVTGAVHRKTLAEAGVPAFASPEQAVRAFQHLVRDRAARAAARELPPADVLSVKPDQASVRRIVEQARMRPGGVLSADQSLDVFAAYGIATVPGRSVAGAAQAAAAAEALGFPVSLRLELETPGGRQSGRVAPDLRTPPEVLSEADALLLWQERRAPGVSGTLLVQKATGRAHALRIEVAADPVWGPVITVGFSGGGHRPEGRAAELLPLNLALAHGQILRTRLPLLADDPESSPLPMDELAETLVRVSQLVVEHPEIAALAIDPLYANAEGIAAADAWLRLRLPEEAASPLSIAPYPQELEHVVTLSGGAVVIRPIRPEDAAAHARMFSRMSADDIRYRFFSSLRHLSPEQVARMTQVDYDREMAFVAVDRATGETVGVSRLVAEPRDFKLPDGQVGRRGEFAIVVQPDRKGTGLGRALMEALFDWARRRGLAEIVGQVLPDNTPMVAFVRHMGFSLHRNPGEDDVLEVQRMV